ncbi:MAG: hypothetical protein JST89_02560 [Cyanobacteria bacterium SZAS-4]|nr:hypothetical protein [Cyanobacteria bacterium SZAS-4]
MRRRHDKRGATLSLVVVTTLVIMVAGMAIFFLSKLLGGARELQNATDSGNLNVAKQSLRYPPLKLFSNGGPYDMSGPRLALVQQNFGQLRDPATGELDLLTYNRAVGQAMLVAMNASSDTNSLGVADAKTLIDLLANPNDGLGRALANKLAGDQQMDVSFTNLAQLASIRMLNKAGTSAGNVSTVKDIAYMAPNTATNLQLNPATIPPSFLANNTNFIANNIVSQAGSTYLKGYSFIDIPTVTDNSGFPLMGVPLRPMTNPHLVSDFDFNRLKQTPLGGATSTVASRIPPNAFKSGGFGRESHQGGQVNAQSCAIAGTVAVQGQYTASIPCGFIAVMNGPGMTPLSGTGAVNTQPPAAGLTADGYGGGGRDIFADVLMYNTVYVTGNGAMSQNPQKIVDIQNWMKAQQQAGNPTNPVPANLADGLDGPSPKQSYADGINPNETPSACTNTNSSAGEPGANPNCVNNLSSMASVYGTNLPSAGGAGQLNGLMALEREKAGVINPRPGGGPAVINDLPASANGGVCTGLKAFPTSIGPNDPIQFGQVGTIGSLLAGFSSYPQTAAAESQILSIMTLKLKQIKPTASASEIQTVMNTPLPMGAQRFIWLDDNGTFKVTDQGNLPSWINQTSILADGSTINATTGDLPVVPAFVNIPGEQGFPNPWDCNGSASYRNNLNWTNSSGFNCLQGILRFSNCATDAGQPWHCPC